MRGLRRGLWQYGGAVLASSRMGTLIRKLYVIFSLLEVASELVGSADGQSHGEYSCHLNWIGKKVIKVCLK